MIAVDANILVYAHRKDTPFHTAAIQTLVSLAEGPHAWAIPWPCVSEFLAIVSHPRIYAPPTPLARALTQVEIWMESPTLVLRAESPSSWATFSPLLTASKVTGPRAHDARIMAICREHGVSELWSADRDFGRFNGVSVKNPLVG